MQNLDYWLQILFTAGPVIAGMGVLYEKVRQLEKRLDGNGDSVPGRCKVHEARLNELGKDCQQVSIKLDAVLSRGE